MNHDQKNKEHLDYLYFMYGSFGVMYCYGPSHHVHMQYKDKDYDYHSRNGEQPTDRRIMVDEVVLESDLPTKEENQKVAHMLYQCLDSHDLGYTAWDSGNKSIHIHMRFPQLKKFADKPRRLAQMKERIMRWITYCDRSVDRCRNCIGLLSNGMPCMIRKQKIDLHLCNGTMIRCEHGWNYKTGKNKELIHSMGMDVEMDELLTPMVAQPNEYPIDLEEELAEEPIPQTSLKLRKGSQHCLDYLMNTKLADGKKRALFLICGLLRRNGETIEQAKGLIQMWNVLQGKPFQAQELNDHLKRAYRSAIVPGCTYCSSLLAELGRTDLICKSAK